MTTTITIYNPNRFERMKELVAVGTRLKKIIDSYQSPLTSGELPIRSEAFEKYHQIVQELHAFPEELARRWGEAKRKLIENKIYPYNLK